MSRPFDHVESSADSINQPKLGTGGYLRFFWRQLTSMRTAIILLLLLAIAAVPGSMWPQRSSDPNGVIQFFSQNPDLAPVLDKLQLFDVYTSVWFSAIYLLLFISLIGCVLPRTIHHLKSLRARPPRTPARFERLQAHLTAPLGEADAVQAIDAAQKILKRGGYRVERYDNEKSLSVSAERGYLRETGNLVFHTALIGVLITVGLGGGFGYTGQKVLAEGQSFANVKGNYDSFSPGRFFTDSDLAPFRLKLDGFSATYEENDLLSYGKPIDYTATLSTWEGSDSSESKPATIKVNEPLSIGGTNIYLLGNGYAPTVTVRDGEGNVAYRASVPFLPQDANLTSTGVIRVPDAKPEQLAMIGFFYPTAASLPSGALTSIHPDLRNPVLTLRVFKGDLGLDSGIPQNVYALDPTGLTPVAGGDAAEPAIELTPGQSAELPGGLGTITFESAVPGANESDWTGSVPRFASLDIHHDPAQGWVLAFVLIAIAGLLASLFVPRRRVWVRVSLSKKAAEIEYAALARGEDPRLEAALEEFASRHASELKA
ncbi:MAG: cytochrome c biogenesis protein ResB [Homoserinimonas sp.]|nr:cytochrome c biogenesis protein ResB [Homoserinimonas sp.]MCW5945196.1 cytochrome c biogenesis protein ResB [Cryobacterium sp.]